MKNTKRIIRCVVVFVLCFFVFVIPLSVSADSVNGLFSTYYRTLNRFSYFTVQSGLYTYNISDYRGGNIELNGTVNMQYDIQTIQRDAFGDVTNRYYTTMNFFQNHQNVQLSGGASMLQLGFGTSEIASLSNTNASFYIGYDTYYVHADNPTQICAYGASNSNISNVTYRITAECLIKNPDDGVVTTIPVEYEYTTTSVNDARRWHCTEFFNGQYIYGKYDIHRSIPLVLRNVQIVINPHLNNGDVLTALSIREGAYTESDAINLIEVYNNYYTSGAQINEGYTFEWLLRAVSVFLELEIFPGFKIWYPLLFVTAISVFALIMKMFAGG